MKIPLTRLISGFRRMPPALLLRLAAGTVLALPVLVPAFLLSRRRIRRWKDPRRVRAFLARHPDAFAGVDASDLRIETISGGVSNCSFLWRCRTREGAPIDYAAKLFLPLGSVWARLLPVLGPFPPIEPVSARERLCADAWTRMQLVGHGVAVLEPAVVDFSECVAVNEYRKGEQLTEILRRTRRRGYLTADDKYILWSCGAVIARIHAAGLSVVDAQPANCLWLAGQEEVCMVDFEFSTRTDRRAWDREFFKAALSAQLSGSLRAQAQEAFQRGYASLETGTRAGVREESTMDGFMPMLEAILDLRGLAPEDLVGLAS